MTPLEVYEGLFIHAYLNLFQEFYESVAARESGNRYEYTLQQMAIVQQNARKAAWRKFP